MLHRISHRRSSIKVGFSALVAFVVLNQTGQKEGLPGLRLHAVGVLVKSWVYGDMLRTWCAAKFFEAMPISA